MLFLYVVKVLWLLMTHCDFIKLINRFQNLNAIFCIHWIKINMFNSLIFFSLLNISSLISDLLIAWSSAYKQFISFILLISQILFEICESCFITFFCSYIAFDKVFTHVKHFISYVLIDFSIIKWYMKFLINY